LNALKSDFYQIPLKPILFLGSAKLVNPATQVISIAGVKTLEIDEKGVLDSMFNTSDQASIIDLDKDQFTYFLGGIADSERVFIKASLDAITDVYGFYFAEKESQEEANLIFDRYLPAESSSDKLYFISGNFSFPEQSNIVSFSDQLDFEHSEVVQSGKLPEVILTRFLDYVGVEKQDVPLSQAQLANRFLVESEFGQEKSANLNLLLLGLFIGCFAAERFLANRRGI